MVNSKIFLAIIGGIVIITASILIGIQSEETLIKNPSTSIETSVNDSAVVEKNNQNFIIDAKGNKEYVISVADSPIIGD
ncbi:MAG: hypothetical protein H8D31_00145 [Nitrosopumilus sp.]|nr:hypothetical protein [Nitrosopumilus sp.]